MIAVYAAQHTRSLRVFWALEEMGAPYEVRLTGFPARTNAPAYLAVNPGGTLPAMVDGDVFLTESMAICEYAAAKHGSDLLVPQTDPDYYDYLQWLWYGEATLGSPISTIARLRRITPQEPAFDRVAQDARVMLDLRLLALERRLEGRDFLVADRLTLADLSAAYALHLITTFSMTTLPPLTAAYWQRLAARPAYQRAAAVK